MKLFLISFLIFTQALSFEYSIGTSGYGRIQNSFQEGKENVCFQAPGAGSKYRLGNECETWFEPALFQNIALENGIQIYNKVRPIFFGANDKEIDFFSWGEFYTQISNTFDNDISFWVGRRWFSRFDSHMTDYFYLNTSGDGLGFENLKIRDYSISYSFVFDNLKLSDNLVQNEEIFLQSHDIRIKKNIDRGDITLFFNYVAVNEKNFHATNRVENLNGYAFGLLFNDKVITKELFSMQGSSVIGLFFGKSLGKNAGAHVPYLSAQLEREKLANNLLNSYKSINNSKTLRFINYNTFENNDIGIMSNFVYEYRDDKKFTNLEQTWTTFGIRPYWFLNKNLRVLIESGYDYVHDNIVDKSYSLLKNTLAFELALEKGIMQRPVIRLFYTNAKWSDSATGLVSANYYTNKTSGDNFGIQFEYWW